MYARLKLAGTLAPALALLVLAGCTHKGNRDIARIFIIGHACAGCSASLMIERGGRIQDLSVPSSSRGVQSVPALVG